MTRRAPRMPQQVQVALDLFGQAQAHSPDAYPWADARIVDYFAGGGGASEGIKMALGRSPDVAINHNKIALAMHEANHPETLHLHDDVWHVDPLKITCGGAVLLLWGSPDCRHFSKAKGGKPVKKNIRGLPWVLHRFAAQIRPAVFMMENVEEMTTWGPLVAARDGEFDAKRGGWFKKVGGKSVPATGRVLKIDGTVAAPGEVVPADQQLLRPDPRRGRKGRTFRRFVRDLERKGYVVEYRVLRACDYGIEGDDGELEVEPAPTSRRRLFLIARRDGLPIVWPAPTHGDPASADVKAGRLRPWRTAAEIIDFDLPCPSIFDRAKPLADATAQRIAKGIMRYVAQAGDKAFIVCLTHGARAESCCEPLRTVTGAHRGERGLAVPSLMSIDHQSSGSANTAADELLTSVTSKARHALVAAFLVKNFGGVVGAPLHNPLPTVTQKDHSSLVAVHIQRDFGMSVGHAADAPLGTTTAGAAGHSALVASNLVRLKNEGRQGQAMDEPIGSIQAQGNHWAKVATFLVKYYGTGVDQGTDEPLDAVTQKPRFGLVTLYGEPAFAVEIRGDWYIVVDIGFRMLQPHELFKGQGFPESYEHKHVVVDGEPYTLTKEQEVAACGNSVPPTMVAALVRANVPHYAVRRAAQVE